MFPELLFSDRMPNKMPAVIIASQALGGEYLEDQHDRFTFMGLEFELLYLVMLQHPIVLLATTSTDGKCRVFSTFIKGVDTRESKTGSSSDPKFGEVKSRFCSFINLLSQIVQLDLSSSWTFGVKWSPSGNTLAYVGHNSMIYFVDDIGPSPLAQNVAFRNLPLRDVGQLSILLTAFVSLYFGPKHKFPSGPICFRENGHRRGI
ncbi:actin-related protein 2/3 complex subunit 1A-like isoform X1 [Gossypium australe]|uniref:Actin-related protein 2/3 complex subunit 1A-like isoform X1 n=1 Tax=Gossypium australe TaxID=47621 RepID=A0A5B6WDW3_9ROSI|nr:actin-related protein 2/3 complex subunit 1A-like isoform X1 [Gossypium australe]